MIVYGKDFSRGAMMSEGKNRTIVAVFSSKEAAEGFCKFANDTWSERFSSIQLNTFENKYCKPIGGKAGGKNAAA